MASSTLQTVADPLWQYFGLTRKYRGKKELGKPQSRQENKPACCRLLARLGLTQSKGCGEVTVADPLWQYFGLTKKYRGKIVLPSLGEIGAYPIKRLWRSVQADQSLMHALSF